MVTRCGGYINPCSNSLSGIYYPFWLFKEGSQQAHIVDSTYIQRWFHTMTLNQRWINVESTMCACWGVLLCKLIGCKAPEGAEKTTYIYKNNAIISVFIPFHIMSICVISCLNYFELHHTLIADIAYMYQYLNLNFSLLILLSWGRFIIIMNNQLFCNYFSI